MRVCIQCVDTAAPLLFSSSLQNAITLDPPIRPEFILLKSFKRAERLTSHDEVKRPRYSFIPHLSERRLWRSKCYRCSFMLIIHSPHNLALPLKCYFIFHVCKCQCKKILLTVYFRMAVTLKPKWLSDCLYPLLFTLFSSCRTEISL